MSDIDDSEYRKARKELHDCVNELRKIEGKKPIPWIEAEPPYCSFCGKGKNEVQKTIVSTSVAICNTCIAMSVDILESQMSEKKGGRKEENVKSMVCSFCGKSSSEVQQIIQGPSVFICDECVMKNSEILGKKTYENNKT